MKAILNILLITGIAAIALGFILTLGITPTHSISIPESMTVGSETCFHCHVSQREDWSVMLNTRIILNGNAYPFATQSYAPPLIIEPMPSMDNIPDMTLSPQRTEP